MGKRRFDKLSKEAEAVADGKKEFDLSILTEKERDLIEVAIQEAKMENSDECRTIATFSVEVGEDQELCFEGDIESDGDCITLRTPYDNRDGGFADTGNCWDMG